MGYWYDDHKRTDSGKNVGQMQLGRVLYLLKEIHRRRKTLRAATRPLY